MRIQVTIAFLLGIIATLLAVLVFGDRGGVALADSGASGQVLAVSGNNNPGANNFLWLVDAKSDTPHLTLYEWQGKRLVLQAARNIKYDLAFDQFPGTASAQKPTVQEAFRQTEKARKDSRRPR